MTDEEPEREHGPDGVFFDHDGVRVTRTGRLFPGFIRLIAVGCLVVIATMFGIRVAAGAPLWELFSGSVGISLVPLATLLLGSRRTHRTTVITPSSLTFDEYTLRKYVREVPVVQLLAAEITQVHGQARVEVHTDDGRPDFFFGQDWTDEERARSTGTLNAAIAQAKPVDEGTRQDAPAQLQRMRSQAKDPAST